jgi:hypothetical protein
MQFSHTNGSAHSFVFYVVWFAIAIGLASIPAFIASNKGRPFALWFLFGLFCFLPALIVSIVIGDRSPGAPYAAGGYQQWGPQPGAPPAVPPGWYPDPAGSAQQRYWDGTRWTEHLH